MEVIIYTIEGRKVLVKKSQKINVSSLSKGYYIIEINSFGKLFRDKLIIK